MEWVLQVVDEVDDAVAALRHRLLGLNGEMGALIAALRKTGARRSRRLRRATR
ncbi:MAG TPA: hypothetical protein VKT22_11815 [Steroidobacteraceae bacterium]|nr:hypothetical protein [Steroidobacteraceae bacterium]